MRHKALNLGGVRGDALDADERSHEVLRGHHITFMALAAVITQQGAAPEQLALDQVRRRRFWPVCFVLHERSGPGRGSPGRTKIVWSR